MNVHIVVFQNEYGLVTDCRVFRDFSKANEFSQLLQEQNPNATIILLQERRLED